MGTKYKGKKVVVRALDAYIALMRASASLTARVHTHLVSHNLTPGQFSVLDALYYAGPLRASEIADKVLTSCGNITMILDNLEKLKLLSREREAGDRRCIKVKLSKLGEETFEKISKNHFEIISAEFSVLNQREQTKLKELCKKLGKGRDKSVLA